MKKSILTLLLVALSIVTFGQQWNAITSDTPNTIRKQLVASTEQSITVNVQVTGFYTTEVVTPRGVANIVSVPKTVSTFGAGEPDLPMIAIPAIIGDNQRYSIRVVDAQYQDFSLNVAPSKGDFSREINPEDVPYTYGEAYNQNAFFPESNIGLYEPYILRDFRGQNMVIYPFAYNPATQTLRVYHNMTVEMFSEGVGGENQLTRKSNVVRIDPEIGVLYENQFINYQTSLNRYTPIEEEGDLLIICHDAFMSAMQPFVNWKKQIGRPTTMVGTSTSGTTDTAIKAYIEAQYTSNNNLTHVLLVGDVAQIPGHYMSASGEFGGKSDLWYGQISGNDFYNELFIGRFSAENTDHVTTQVNKVIHYERDINTTDTWLTYGTGVATSAGGGGHFGEDDWQHIDNIRADLLSYNYTEVYRDYQSGGGAHSNSATLSQNINNGVSIINYCNHGSETSWGVFGYNNNNVNALTNTHKLPIVWSVACLNGKYDHSQPCFGETWLRANNGNDPEQPTGAIGGMFSYISQPWVPPMYGQDEMIDILIESYTNNIKRTLGGTSINGNMKVLDQYGSQGQGTGTYNCWILYGDPTLTLRNAVPNDMGVSHQPTLGTSSTTFSVTATNGDGARATLTRNNEIMGSAIINNGTANITYAAPGQTGTATLTVFGYNKITYIATIEITAGGGPDPVSVSVSANPTTISQGSNSQLNAVATGGDGSYTYSWSPTTGLSNANIQSPTATPTQTTTYTCTVTSAGLSASGSCTVTVVKAPTNLTASVQNNTNVSLTWQPANPAQSYKIYRDNVMIAQNITSSSYTDSNLSQGTYSYQVATIYNGIESPKSNTATVTIYAPLSVTATASPSVYPLAPGCSTSLTANPVGGNGNYTYSWTPAASVNNPNAQTTTASPGEGLTTYIVSVSSNGETAQANVTVAVVASPDITLKLEGDNNVLITWSDAPIADYYNVYEYFNGTYSDNELIATNVTDNSFIHENLEDGEHCYYVTAVYQNVEATEILDSCITIDTFICYGPEDFSAEYYWDDWEFGARLMWEKNEAVNMDITKFRIYRDDELIRELVNVPYTYHYEMIDDEIELGSHTYVVSAYYQDQDCETFSDPVTLEITGVENNMLKANIFPNPTQDNITIQMEGMKQISIVNGIGQEVFRADVETDQYTLDMSQFGQGIFVVRIATENGQAVKHIVVE